MVSSELAYLGRIEGLDETDDMEALTPTVWRRSPARIGWSVGAGERSPC